MKFQTVLFFLVPFVLTFLGCNSNASDDNNKNVSVAQHEIVKGEQLIQGSDCTTCHSVSDAGVGPSFVQIASKYGSDKNNVEYLFTKIISGGSGVWGQTPMLPHPAIYKDDAVLMTKYILSQK